MSKINAKLRAAQLDKQKEEEAASAADGVEGVDGLPVASKTAPVAAPPPAMTTLFDAAKQGDVEAASNMLDEGADVNAKVRGWCGDQSSQCSVVPAIGMLCLLALIWDLSILLFLSLMRSYLSPALKANVISRLWPFKGMAVLELPPHSPLTFLPAE